MLSTAAKSVVRGRVASRPPARAFWQWYKQQWEGKEPHTHHDHVAGRQKLQEYASEQGMVAFNRDPIFAAPGSGTKENPIEVPSIHHERVVGYECPEVHQLMWFNLAEGKIHYIPKIDKHFKLVKAEDIDVKFE